MSLFNKLSATVQGWCHVRAALHHRHARSEPLRWEAHWRQECPQSFSWPESGSRNILCGKYFFETVSAFFKSSRCLKHRSIRLQMLWEMRHRGGGQSWGLGIDRGRGRLALVWRSLGISWTPLLHHFPVVVVVMTVCDTSQWGNCGPGMANGTSTPPEPAAEWQ